MLPTAVMQRAREEFLDWHGTGLSVMELGHRTPEFIAIAEQAEANLREILSIPDNFAILFLQGGATSQFSMVPLNLTAPGDRVDALYTGLWSGKAIKEAGRYCSVNVAASSENNHFTAIPDTLDWQLSANARYLYFTDNETVHGVEFQQTPKSGEVPLVSDMTSNLLTRPIDFSAYGLIFAGAQKNLGPAGLTLVIVREDLLGNSRQDIPRLYDYAFNAKEHSMANTPPTYSWYMAGLVLQWIKQEGGIPVMEQRAIAALRFEPLPGHLRFHVDGLKRALIHAGSTAVTGDGVYIRRPVARFRQGNGIEATYFSTGSASFARRRVDDGKGAPHEIVRLQHCRPEYQP